MVLDLIDMFERKVASHGWIIFSFVLYGKQLRNARIFIP
jgi:hypothetical protein